MRKLTAVTILVCLAIIGGCDKSSEPSPSTTFPTSADLLGLNRDHILEYIIYDSIVTIIPDYSVTVDTNEMTVAVSQGQGDQVELNIDGLPRDVLTLDELGILHTGHINSQVIPVDTNFYTPTPIIMPHRVTVDLTWPVVSPQYNTKEALLFLYDGYFAERTFIGQAEIILPTDSYQAYHFQVLLFKNDSDSDTLVTVDEYYAENVGLIKLLSRAGASRRLIILKTDD